MKSILLVICATIVYSFQNVILEQKLSKYSSVSLLVCIYPVMLVVALFHFMIVKDTNDFSSVPKSLFLFMIIYSLVYYFADLMFFSAFTTGGNLIAITTVVAMLPVFASIIKFAWVREAPNIWQVSGYILAFIAIILVTIGSSLAQSTPLGSVFILTIDVFYVIWADIFNHFFMSFLRKINPLTLVRKIYNGFDRKKKSHWLYLAIAVLIILVAGSRIIGGSTPIATEDDKGLRLVQLATVAELSNDSGPLPITGLVKSKSEAIVSAEAGGRVIKVYRTVGQRLAAGSIIAELENSVQRASVLQAEGAFDSAKANLERTKSGARSETISSAEARLNNAESSLAQARNQTVNSIRGSFATVDDAVRNRIDELFENAYLTSPQIKFTMFDPQLENDIEFQRLELNSILNNWEESLDSLNSNDDLFASLDEARDVLTYIRDFNDDLFTAVNSLAENSNLSQATINLYKGNISASRSGILSELSKISGAIENLNGKITALEIAKNDVSQSSGGRDEDVSAAEAGLKQAEGALAIAKANLEKTIIRSPIAGTLNSVDIEQGDFVTTFQEVAFVSNNSTLEILGFITESEKTNVASGAKVSIDGKYKGSVIRVAPSLDRKTKKIEIKVSINDRNVDLINGQSVRLEIERTYNKVNQNDNISIPIAALKILPNSTVVFSLDENNRLRSHEVTLGPIVGDKIVIESGVNGDLEIITDARGLKEGEEVLTN